MRLMLQAQRVPQAPMPTTVAEWQLGAKDAAALGQAEKTALARDLVHDQTCQGEVAKIMPPSTSSVTGSSPGSRRGRVRLVEAVVRAGRRASCSSGSR